MKKPFSADWRAITCNEDEEQFVTKAETERVVREFQRRSGMRVTGVVDAATAKVLARYHIDVM